MQSLLIFIIKIYQYFFSYLYGNSCRFYPSCSRYSIDVIRKRGALLGVIYTFLRVLKCNRFHSGGYDPV